MPIHPQWALRPRAGAGLLAALWWSRDTRRDDQGSRRLCQPEMIGLYALLLARPSVVDVEIAFVAEAIAGTDETDRGEQPDGALAAIETSSSADPAAHASPLRRQNRLDFATLEACGNTVAVVFQEAKHFANPKLLPPALEPHRLSSRWRSAAGRSDTMPQRTRRVTATFALRLPVSRPCADGCAVWMPWPPLIHS